MPAFLAEPIVKYLSAAIVALLLLFGAYAQGRSDGRNLVIGQVAAQKLEWEGKVHDLQLQHQKDIDDLATEYIKDLTLWSKQIEDLKKHPRIITKYIPIHVDTPVPKGLLVLHDRAARGENLDKDVLNAADPSPVILSKFGVTLAENYTSCVKDRAKLATLQETVKKFQAAQKELTK